MAPAAAKRIAERHLKILELTEGEGAEDYLSGFNRNSETKLTLEDLELMRSEYQQCGMYALLPKEYHKPVQIPITEILQLIDPDHDPENGV